MGLDIFIGIFKVITFLIIFASVLFLAYISTRYIGKKASIAMKGKFIKIEETLSLGVDKKIYLVKAGKKYFLMASSGKNFQFLTEVEIDDAENAIGDIYVNNIEETNVQGAYKISGLKGEFKNVLDKYIYSYKTAAPGKKTGNKKEEEHSDDLNKAGDGIKGNLNKLKNITNKVKQEDNNETTTEK